MKIQANLPVNQAQIFNPGKALESLRTAREAGGSPETVMKTEQPVRVSVSLEGFDAYRRMIQEKDQSPSLEETQRDRENMILIDQLYGSIGSSTVYFATEEEVLEKKDLKQNIIPLWFSEEVKALEEKEGTNTWKDKASRLAQTYTKLYEEIVRGYAEGTREVRVVEEGATVAQLAHGQGYRILTMEEELNQLDAVYEKKVADLEETAKEWPRQFEIFVQMDKKISEAMGRERKYSEKDIEERYKDYKTIPDQLGQRMLSVRDNWKALRKTSSADQAWQNVIELIHTMFRYRE